MDSRDAELRAIDELRPAALEAAQVACGHLKAGDEAFEAVCSYVEQWYRERGHTVSVRFAALYSLGHHGPTGVRFTITPRAELLRTFLLTVKL